METHHDNADVLEHACSTLGEIASNADNQVAIVAAGGIAVRIAALGHYLPTPPCSYPSHHAQPISNLNGNYDPKSCKSPNYPNNYASPRPFPILLTFLLTIDFQFVLFPTRIIIITHTQPLIIAYSDYHPIPIFTITLTYP